VGAAAVADEEPASSLRQAHLPSMDAASVADSVHWGRGSIAECEEQFSIVQCPRVMRLLNVTPPRFISGFFKLALSEVALCEPNVTHHKYWDEVHCVLDSIPRNFDAPSEALIQFRTLIVPRAGEAAAQYMRGREVRFLLLSFLSPPPNELRVDEVVRLPIAETVQLIGDYFEGHLDVARNALNVIMLTLADWEVNDRLGLALDSLGVPVVHYDNLVPEGLMLAAAQANGRGSRRDPRPWRQRFYEDFVQKCPPLGVRPFEDFEKDTAIVRKDPVMMAALLLKLPPCMGKHPDRLWPHEQFFAEFVYRDMDVPLDVGRQALAFSYVHVLEVWNLMNWPRQRVVLERLHALACNAAYRITREQMFDVLMHKFA